MLTRAFYQRIHAVLLEKNYYQILKNLFNYWIGKARRLKQAKDEATEEIEKYRTDRDKQFKEFESKVKFKSKLFVY